MFGSTRRFKPAHKHVETLLCNLSRCLQHSPALSPCPVQSGIENASFPASIPLLQPPLKAQTSSCHTQNKTKAQPEKKYVFNREAMAEDLLPTVQSDLPDQLSPGQKQIEWRSVPTHSSERVDSLLHSPIHATPKLSCCTYNQTHSQPHHTIPKAGPTSCLTHLGPDCGLEPPGE